MTDEFFHCDLCYFITMSADESDSDVDSLEGWKLEEHQAAVELLRQEFNRLKKRHLQETESAIQERVRDVNNGMDPDFKVILKRLESEHQSKRELNDTRKRLREANTAAWYAGELQLAEQTFVEGKKMLQDRLIRKLEMRRSIAILAHQSRQKPPREPEFDKMAGSRSMMHLLKSLPDNQRVEALLAKPETESKAADSQLLTEDTNEGKKTGPPSAHFA